MTTKLNPEKPDGGETRKPLYWQIKSGRRLYCFGHEPIAEPVYEVRGRAIGQIIFDEYDGLPSPQPSAEATEPICGAWAYTKGDQAYCQLPKGHEGDCHWDFLENIATALQGQKDRRPAPSGETRGTPEKVCDWKADGWTIDPKILGEIEDDPRVRAEGDPGLEMVEAILLAADWKPLAPEATTKEPGANILSQISALLGRTKVGELPDYFVNELERLLSVAPGEAVGRETGEQQIENISQWRAIQHAFVTIGRNMEVPMDMRELATRMRDVIEPQCIDLTGELSTLRRERDQLLSRVEILEGLHRAGATNLENWETSYNTLYERAHVLESQVRELAAQRDKQRIGLEKINYIRQSIVGSEQVNWSEHIYPLVAALDEAGLVSLEYGEARNNFGQLFKRNQDLESQVAELRATVEKLERLRAEFIWLAHCPSRPTFCNCRAHVALEAELYDMRKGRPCRVTYRRVELAT